MNKVDLVDELAKRTGLTKVESEKAFDSIFDIISDSLEKGEKVIVSGFGTFEVIERIARPGHDPRTKEIIQLPAMKTAKFKVGKVLKEKVK